MINYASKTNIEDNEFNSPVTNDYNIDNIAIAYTKKRFH